MEDVIWGNVAASSGPPQVGEGLPIPHAPSPRISPARCPQPWGLLFNPVCTEVKEIFADLSPEGQSPAAHEALQVKIDQTQAQDSLRSLPWLPSSGAGTQRTSGTLCHTPTPSGCCSLSSWREGALPALLELPLLLLGVGKAEPSWMDANQGGEPEGPVPGARSTCVRRARARTPSR